MRLFELVVASLVVVACSRTPPIKVYDSPPTSTESLKVVLDRPDRMFIEHLPIVVAGGDEAFVYRDAIMISIAGRRLREVFIFNGLDRGDVAEVDTSVSVDGVPVFLRSMHKEDVFTFDSWESKRVNVVGQWLRIDILCRTTGPNERARHLASRPHWGIWLRFHPVPPRVDEPVMLGDHIHGFTAFTLVETYSPVGFETIADFRSQYIVQVLEHMRSRGYNVARVGAQTE
jgi:hypothetical protein